MRALVYGGGAVGLGLASCLLKSGTQVDILARRDTVASLRKDGLVRTGIFGDYRAAPSAITCRASLDELPSQVYDYILVCTKSFDSFDAAKDLSEHKSLFADGTKIVLFKTDGATPKPFLPFSKKRESTMLASSPDSSGVNPMKWLSRSTPTRFISVVCSEATYHWSAS